MINKQKTQKTRFFDDKVKKNSSYKAHRRVFFSFLIFSMALILCINLVSAFDFDNVKTYDSKTKTAKIENAYGLGADIAEITLLSGDSVPVIVGYRKVAEFEINNLDGNYNKPIKNIRSYNILNNMKELNKQFDYKYWNGNDWVLFENGEIPIGKTKIGLFVDVKKGDYVEWIPNLYGVDISEWATYYESSIYDSFNDSSLNTTQFNFLRGTCAGGGSAWAETIVANASCLSGGEVPITFQVQPNGYNWSSQNFTIIFDADFTTTDPNRALCFYWETNGSLSADGRCRTGGYVLGTSTLSGAKLSWIPNATTIGVFLNGVHKFSLPFNTIGFNPTLGMSQGGNVKYILTLHEMNLTLPFMDTIGDINVSLISPTDNYQSLNTSLDFQGNFKMYDGNFTNATLYIWNSDTTLFGINTTTITGNSTNTSTLSLGGLPYSSGYKWNYRVCGVNNSLSTMCFFASSNRTFSVTSFTEGNSAYGNNVNETSNQFFELNITTIPGILSVTATLNYNGTEYLSDTSCTGVSCSIKNTIDISLVQGDYESQNKTFLWELSVFDGSSEAIFNSTTKSQNVSRIHLEQCNATYTTKTLNFTVYNEKNLTRVIPFEFDGAFDYWLGSGSVKRNNSFSENVTEINFCLSPTSTIMKTSATIDYDDSTNTTSLYTSRFYYFDNHNISSTLQHIPLYLLESTSSTSFILKVQDENLLPVSDALIEVHRYYPGEGLFKIVQIAKTDDNGKSIGFFETETVDYKFIIKKAGVTLLETGQQKVIPETAPYTLTFNTGTNLGEPWESQNDIVSLNSTLTWNENTGIVTYTYIDTSSNLTLARLLVQKVSLTNSTAYTTICNTNSTLSSATITCNVGNSSGFYIASSYITRIGEGLDKQISFQIETFSSQAGLLGLFFGWFLILISAFMFKFNEVAGIWAVTVTIFLVNILGLIKFGAVFVSAIIGIAVILSWIMER